MYKKNHLVDDRQHAHLPSAESFYPQNRPCTPKNKCIKKITLQIIDSMPIYPLQRFFFTPKIGPVPPKLQGLSICRGTKLRKKQQLYPIVPTVSKLSGHPDREREHWMSRKPHKKTMFESISVFTVYIHWTGITTFFFHIRSLISLRSLYFSQRASRLES